MRALRTCALAALAAAALANAAVAEAGPPRPTDLSVVGGAGWHADNGFSLTWLDPAPSDPPLTRTHYRVRNPLGATVVEGILNRVTDGLGPLLVPRVPASYSAEMWFEDALGGQGPVATVALRFDDSRPEAVAAEAAPEWIGRTAFPLHLRLGHPPGPLPLSGIRGYAASIDADPRGTPCSHADLCTVAETTLGGGIEDDDLRVPLLPEGVAYLHVVAVSGAGMKSSPSGSTVLRVDTTDPVTRLSGEPTGWTNRAVDLIASASDGASGMARVGDGPAPFTAIRVDDAAPTIAFGESATASVIAEGAHRVAYYARDAAGNIDDGATSNGVPDHPPRIASVSIDRTPPDVAFANSQDPRDPDLIRASIADPLSGPDTTRGWIGFRRAGSGDPFGRLPSAPPAKGGLRARWNSDAYPTGEYEFEAVGYDAAGNFAVTRCRANGERMILTNPLKATTSLRDAFGRHGLSRTVPYGRGVRLHGRLATGLSSALADAPLRVVERFAPGAHPAIRVSTVRTGPDGAFSIRTRPGPSRTIELTYEGSPTLRRASGPTLHLSVRSRVRLAASAGSAQVGGKPLVFRGRVAAAAGTIPVDGIAVQLQFRLGNSPWSEFRTVQTDRRGRFRYPYRFTDDDSRGVRFQFRAYVAPHDDWPYEPAGSRPIIVRGR